MKMTFLNSMWNLRSMRLLYVDVLGPNKMAAIDFRTADRHREQTTRGMNEVQKGNTYGE